MLTFTLKNKCLTISMKLFICCVLHLHPLLFTMLSAINEDLRDLCVCSLTAYTQNFCNHLLKGLFTLSSWRIVFICHVQTYAAEGRFTFTSSTPGEHIICLLANSTAWFGGGTLVSAAFVSRIIDSCSSECWCLNASLRCSAFHMRMRVLLG